MQSFQKDNNTVPFWSICGQFVVTPKKYIKRYSLKK